MSEVSKGFQENSQDIGVNTLNWLRSGSEARAKQIAEREKKRQQNPAAALEQLKNQVLKKEEK